MTIKELCQWVVKAEEQHETTWEEYKTGESMIVGKYSESIFKSIEKTRPVGATDTEESIAKAFIHSFWSDVQDWAAAKDLT